MDYVVTMVHDYSYTSIHERVLNSNLTFYIYIYFIENLDD